MEGSQEPGLTAPRDRVARVRKVYESWARGDLGAGPELWAEDAVFDTIADARSRWVGTEEIGSYMRQFLAQWNNFTITAEDFEEVGDTVIVTERQRGTPARRAASRSIRSTTRIDLPRPRGG